MARPTIKSLKIKEAARERDENLSERSELFSSVVGDSVAFSQGFIVSLDFFGLACAELVSASHQEKNEHAKNQHITKICYIELRLIKRLANHVISNLH